MHGVATRTQRQHLTLVTQTNVLDTIIWLEKQGKSTKQSASYTTESAAQSDVSPEMEAAQIAYQKNQVNLIS